MRNRKQPFGYELKNGRIVVATREAEIVKQIFRGYALGESLQNIATLLSTGDVPYMGDCVRWNKNMVSRILACGSYLGNDEFPAILTQDEYEKALAEKQAVQRDTAKSRQNRMLRSICRCSACGSEISLVRSGKKGKQCKCQKCGMLAGKAATEKALCGIASLCKAIRDGEIKIMTPEREDEPNVALHQLELSFDEALNSDSFDENAAVSLAFGLAAARYKALGDGEYQSMRIRGLLEKSGSQELPDEELLYQIATSIQICQNGMVLIELTNGQVLEGG